MGYSASVDSYLIGTVTIWGGGSSTIPNNWMICDGTSLVRADYPDLYNITGVCFGAADGTHFNIPDLRGLFVRGKDGAASNDPDSSSRTALNGGCSGNNVGSYQKSAIRDHSHSQSRISQICMNGGRSTINAYCGGVFDLYDESVYHGDSGNNAFESRPNNRCFYYIIKVKS